MKDVIILSIGYNHFALKGKPAIAGKLLELLSDMVEVRRDYNHVSVSRETFRLQPHSVELKVEMVESSAIKPPSEDDKAGPDVVDIKALPGAMRLLKGGRS